MAGYLSFYDRDRYSSIMTNLSEIETFQRQMKIDDQVKFDIIREDILRLTTDTPRDDELHAGARAAQLASLKTKLDTLWKEQNTSTRKN